MGISAKEFFDSADSKKQTLYRRITPSDEQFEEQQQRWNELADYLVSDLKDRSGYPIRTWLQGSYKFGTQVRPAKMGDEYDIDLGVYFLWEGHEDDGVFSAVEIKDIVQESAKNYFCEDVLEVIDPAKSKCSRIKYNGDFHIDIPSYHLDIDNDRRRLATSDSVWENSDPKALYVWFKNKFDNDDRRLVRRQVRYLKIWVLLKFGQENIRPSSTLLTVLVSEAFSELDISSLEGDDEILGSILSTVFERLSDDRTVLNPVSEENEDLASNLDDEAYSTFLAQLDKFIDVSVEALDSADIVSSAQVWAEAFEHFFPMPEESTTAKDVRFGLPNILVTAVAKNNKDRKWSGVNKIGPIPKSCTINFQIEDSENLPADLEVQWMVRNESSEAEFVNDLGHFAGTGYSADENSAYTGAHYMDCVFRRDGMFVGLRRVRVEIGGQAMPRRNPKTKPDWVLHRGRK